MFDRYVDILRPDGFQTALKDATEYQCDEILNCRQMLGRISSVSSLGKFN